MSEHTARLVERLRARLQRTIRRRLGADVAVGTSIVIGTGATLWLLAAVLESLLWLPSLGRTLLLIGIALGVLVATGLYLARPLSHLLGITSPPSEKAMARTIGQHYPDVSDRLVNLLDLAEGQRSDAPDAWIDQAVQHLGEAVDPVPFEEIEDFATARRAAGLTTLPVVAVLAFLLAAPSTFLDASERLLAPQTEFERPAPFQLAIQPGNVRLVKGDSLQITVSATGETPDRLTLLTQPDGQDRPEALTLSADSMGRFRHVVPGIRQSLRYRVEAAPVQSPWYTVDVTARPMVRRLNVTVTPPRYTGLPERTLDANVGDVTGLPGSRVTVRARLGGPDVQSATLVFDDGTERPLDIENGTATGSFPLTREGEYRLRLLSTTDIRNRAPIRYQTALRADARPSIAFLAPEPDATIDDDLVAQLRLRMSDDFGFSRMMLHYRLAEKSYGAPQAEFSSLDIPVEQPRQLDQEVVHQWLLAQDSGLDLVPGDVVAYYVEVWDNDAVAGFKAARTATQRLRLPSLAESYKELEEQQNSTEEQMEQLQDEAEQMGEQFRDLRDELRRTQDADWEDQRQMDQLKQRQQSLEEGVNELSRQMQEMTQQMQEDNLTSPETTEMYQELQRVIEEIDSPELREALQKLQDSMKDLDLRQMQQALEDFEFNEQQYRERMQRALDLFKQLKAQQQLDELARRAEDLQKRQDRLSEETERRMKQDEGDVEPSDTAATDANDAEAPDESTSSAPESQTSESENAHPEHSDAQRAQDPTESTSDSNEDLAQEQERSAEEMEQLMKKLQEMATEMQDVPASPQEQMEQMQQQMQQQNLPEQMRQNSEQLRQNQLNEAQQGQQQMSQQLQQMQQRLQQMKQGMQGQQQQMNMAGLRTALDNILRLSRSQEEMRTSVSALSAESPVLREFAQEQETLSGGLQTVSDSLRNIARRVPQMSRTVQKQTGDALRAMDRATESLSERNAPRATGHQKTSMMHLNELALLLSDLLDQMQNQQGGGGGGMSMQQMMQQLQQMSGQQQKLNQQIQQMLNDMQGNRLSTDQQQRLQQLAEQQRRIQEQLKTLSDEGQEAGNDVLGDLNRIAEQMEDTIEELQQGQQSPRTIERQRQILTRMLQAQQSLRTQGREKKRRGQRAEEIDRRESPEDITPQEQADRLRRDLIRALESGYAPDYEALIRRYFELLQQSEDQ